MDLVVGVDAGGTTSRAVVATVDGLVVGRATAGPGNPISAGIGAASSIGRAVQSALSDSDPSRVVGGVLGLAGTSVVSDPAVAAAFAAMWGSLGLRCPLAFVGDVVTAFAAGTSAPSGAVLIAGTGAIAARIAAYEIAETADGLGWLLGDLGSGRWLGLSALRAAVRNWSSPFAAAVAAQTRVGSADALVRWAQSLPLAEIGELAPLVCSSARSGDPLACEIVDAAAGHLVATLDSVSPDGPVVLAGGLLAGDSPVRDGVLTRLQGRGIATGTSGDPAAAAAWLAARSVALLGRRTLPAHSAFV